MEGVEAWTLILETLETFSVRMSNKLELKSWLSCRNGGVGVRCEV